MSKSFRFSFNMRLLLLFFLIFATSQCYGGFNFGGNGFRRGGFGENKGGSMNGANKGGIMNGANKGGVMNGASKGGINIKTGGGFQGVAGGKSNQWADKTKEWRNKWKNGGSHHYNHGGYKQAYMGNQMKVHVNAYVNAYLVSAVEDSPISDVIEKCVGYSEKKVRYYMARKQGGWKNRNKSGRTGRSLQESHSEPNENKQAVPRSRVHNVTRKWTCDEKCKAKQRIYFFLKCMKKVDTALSDNILHQMNIDRICESTDIANYQEAISDLVDVVDTLECGRNSSEGNQEKIIEALETFDENIKDASSEDGTKVCVVQKGMHNLKKASCKKMHKCKKEWMERIKAERSSKDDKDDDDADDDDDDDDEEDDEEDNNIIDKDDHVLIDDGIKRENNPPYFIED